MIEIIGATRLSESDFWSKSALGLSLRRLAYDARLVAHVVFANQRCLPDIFNARISAPDSRDLFVFMHDDVWIDDYFLADRVIEGLQKYDVIGVAGNRRRATYQPNWAWVSVGNGFARDDQANLSGSIAHGPQPFGPVSCFGPGPADCELLDGVFLAAKKSALLDKGLRFDPRFAFHFYDMDFCRCARQSGLRLGTWPICLTHQSSGAFDKAWRDTFRAYAEKWGA